MVRRKVMDCASGSSERMREYGELALVDALLRSQYAARRAKAPARPIAAEKGFGHGWLKAAGWTLAAVGLTAIAATTYQKAHDRLCAQFEDWLTWTPGEERFYFSYVPRWGGLVGESTSYDSETFNDHHFHYGYFTYSGALLCLVDEDFRQKFGPMLRLIAGDYANWNRADRRFPFFRTFDPWAGHSFAGGLGDGNGNGQESSSEAMQGGRTLPARPGAWGSRDARCGHLRLGDGGAGNGGVLVRPRP